MTDRDANTPQKRHVILLGQPRSGTVIFWKTLRQDRRLHCFNKPFHPLIRHHAERGIDHRKQTMGEEDFAHNPEQIVRSIYERLDVDYRALDYTEVGRAIESALEARSAVRRPNRPFGFDRPEWTSALRRNTTPSSRRFLFDFAGKEGNPLRSNDVANAA